MLEGRDTFGVGGSVTDDGLCLRFADYLLCVVLVDCDIETLGYIFTMSYNTYAFHPSHVTCPQNLK
jgi:hypothetical protein